MSDTVRTIAAKKSRVNLGNRWLETVLSPQPTYGVFGQTHWPPKSLGQRAHMVNNPAGARKDARNYAVAQTCRSEGLPLISQHNSVATYRGKPPSSGGHPLPGRFQ